MIVGSIFALLIIVLAATIVYGRRQIRTEKTDAVFGNPSRALGGWHWVVAGASSILLLWFYFSWDAARAYFPTAGNELCQVAKLHRAVNPIRATFPLAGGLLSGTKLLQREYAQIQLLEKQLDSSDNVWSAFEKNELRSIIMQMRAVLAAQANPQFTDPQVGAEFENIAQRINALHIDMAKPGYPGKIDAALNSAALVQPGWGLSDVELPPLPQTARGRKFAAAADTMQDIAKDFVAIRNNGGAIGEQLAEIKTRYDNFVAMQPELSAEPQDFLKQINKVLRRVDDGRIFPPHMTDGIERELIALDKRQKSLQGSLRYIDILAMPGGVILAGNNNCSEQGSGRWLPKPSDTLRTFTRLIDPEVGYKGIPMLWYKMKPLSEMLGFILPDGIANLIPGEFPRHDENGQISTNFKTKVHNFVTGNYPSPAIPIPAGHIWDSIMRVLAGLFLGIILGVPLGIFMGLSRFAKGYFDPLIELYRPIPPLAWAPLILTIFGIQDDGKIFLLFMVAFAIMVISARTGATGTQLSKIHAAHSLGASKKQIIWKVILPNSLPEILTGIRIAIGVCWGTLVAAEMLAGTTGIGFVENVARKQSDYEIIWMTILLLGLLGLAFDLVMRRVINKSIPWRGKG